MHGKVTYISFNTAHGSDRVIRQCMELGSREVVVFEALVDVEAESVVFHIIKSAFPFNKTKTALPLTF